MILEIIIFGAITGIIVIVGRKLPMVTNSNQYIVADKFTMTKIKDETSNKKETIESMNFEENEQNEKELDEILKNIDFLNENNEDEFWEPTFFEENKPDEKEKTEPKSAKKFIPKIKNISDGYELPKEKGKPEAIPVQSTRDEKKGEVKRETREENLVPKKVLPKTPIGIGLVTNLTLRDLLVQANNSFSAKNFLKAEEFYVKAASYDPNNPRIYSRLGIIYLKQGKYHDAKESLKYAISLDDSAATHFFNMSIACMKLGEIDEAVTNLKKAVALEPDNQKYHEILRQIS